MLASISTSVAVLLQRVACGLLLTYFLTYFWLPIVEHSAVCWACHLGAT
jgi:hypothetical protein